MIFLLLGALLMGQIAGSLSPDSITGFAEKFLHQDELTWLTDLFQWLLDTVFRYLFRGFKEPLDLDPIRIDVKYGNLLSLRGDLGGATLGGFPNLNITILEITPRDTEVLIDLPQIAIKGDIDEVEGKIWSWLPYRGGSGLDIFINGVKGHLKGGGLDLSIANIAVNLTPTYTTGSFVAFGALGLLVAILFINFLVTLFIGGRRLYRRYKKRGGLEKIEDTAVAD